MSVSTNQASTIVPSLYKNKPRTLGYIESFTISAFAPAGISNLKTNSISNSI